MPKFAIRVPKSYNPNREIAKTLERLYNDTIVRQLVARYNKAIARTDKSKRLSSLHQRSGKFRFIPYRNGAALINTFAAIRAMLPGGEVKAVDAGCGCGNILYMLHMADFKTTGFELEDFSIRISRRFFKDLNKSIAVKKQDIIKADYSGFDLVYFFCPLADSRQEGAFEARVAETLPIGGFVASAYYSSMLYSLSRQKEDKAFARVLIPLHSNDRSGEGIVVYRKLRKTTPEDIKKMIHPWES